MRCPAWQRLETDRRNIQMRREVHRVGTNVWTVHSAAKNRFLQRYVEELEEKANQNNQVGSSSVSCP